MAEQQGYGEGTAGYGDGMGGYAGAGYLISASYNWAKWNELSDAERYEAREVALRLFPTDRAMTMDDLREQQGILRASSFASDIFGRLPSDYNQRERSERELLLAIAYSMKPAKTPIGWMVVLPPDQLRAYIGRMNSATSALWRMYDVVIRPLVDGSEREIQAAVPALRNDPDPFSIYLYMTPSNWN